MAVRQGDIIRESGRLQGRRRYGYRNVPGRVEPGAETESDAGSQSRVDTQFNEHFESVFNAVSPSTAILRTVLDHGAHFEDGQVHGDNQAADEDAKKGHNQGFQQAGERVHGIVHFFLVEVGDLAQHLIQ